MFRDISNNDARTILLFEERREEEVDNQREREMMDTRDKFEEELQEQELAEK